MPKVTVEEVFEPEEYYNEDYSSMFYSHASELSDLEGKEAIIISDAQKGQGKGKKEEQKEREEK
jgi:hypothetical protein